MGARRSALPAKLGNGINYGVQVVKQFSGPMMGVRSEPLFFSPSTDFYYWNDFEADRFVSNVGAELGNIYTVGSPTGYNLIANEANGVLQLKCASTSEAETNAFDWNDNRNIPANAQSIYLEVRARIPTAVAANQRIIIGLCSSWHANAGSLRNISRYAWFRLEANMTLTSELWDGTTLTSSLGGTPEARTLTAASGAAGFYQFSIERTNAGNFAFRVADYQGQQVGLLNSIPGGGMDSTTLQPIIMVQKDSGTGQPEVDVDYVMELHARY